MKDFENIIENLYDGIYYVDAQRTITYWNKAAERMTGFHRAEVLGRSCRDNILSHVNEDGVLLCKMDCPLSQTLLDGKFRETEVYLHHKDGHRVPVSIRISPVRDEGGTIIGAVEIFHETNSKDFLRMRMRELEKLVLLDSLTKLANRRYIEITIKNRIDELQRYKWPAGILFFDIDHFKAVNDNYGHLAGDQILIMVANTLVESSRSFDLFGRWGGEEMIGVIRNVNGEALQRMAEKLRQLIAHSFIVVNDKKITVTVSIGATLLTAEDSVEAAVDRADRLMYESKKNGRNRVTSDC
jgi:diguanylate cyclase (GGDEF)-like protein/PAS domain S-box-containing protein